MFFDLDVTDYTKISPVMHNNAPTTHTNIKNVKLYSFKFTCIIEAVFERIKKPP